MSEHMETGDSTAFSCGACRLRSELGKERIFDWAELIIRFYQ